MGILQRRTSRTVATLAGVAGASLAGAALWYQLSPREDLTPFRELLHDQPATEQPGTVNVTFLGTTMMLVDDGETQILLDPFITATPAWKFLTRVKVSTDEQAVDRALRRAGAREVSAIFVSHSHHDHLFDLAYVARRTGAAVYGSESTLNVARGGGVPEEQLHVVEPGAAIRVGSMAVTPVPSRHSPHPFGGECATIDAPLSQPVPASTYREGGTFDFLVTAGDQRLLFKGSANWVDGALDGLDVDTVFLGVATLGKQDPEFVDRYFEQTLDAVKPRLVVPTHWNDMFIPATTWPRLNRRYFDNAPKSFRLAQAACAARGIDFRILNVYSAIALPLTPAGQSVRSR